MTPSSDPQFPHGETRLRESLPPLADEGFANHVLAALPPPAPRAATHGRFIFATAGALLGLAFVTIKSATGGETPLDLEALAAMIAPLLTPLTDPMIWIALGTAAASAVYAFWSNPGRRSRV